MYVAVTKNSIVVRRTLKSTGAAMLFVDKWSRELDIAKMNGKRYTPDQKRFYFCYALGLMLDNRHNPSLIMKFIVDTVRIVQKYKIHRYDRDVSIYIYCSNFQKGSKINTIQEFYESCR